LLSDARRVTCVHSYPRTWAKAPLKVGAALVYDPVCWSRAMRLAIGAWMSKATEEKKPNESESCGFAWPFFL
jgi:hypothetical protein